MVAPLFVDPQLDPKPWGGRGLELFGFPLPPDIPIGEALITAPASRVRGGVSPESQLGELAATEPAALVGSRGLAVTGGRPVFPLLVKLIDAVDNLSIQVHPDDDAARSDDRLGKTEAWHVLATAPGAVLYLGLRQDVSDTELAAVCRKGGAAVGCLRKVAAIPGTTFLIPAGTVHALGAGVLVYEVQQPSDVTYRLDDWGRVDAAGRARDLHLDAGLAVVNEASRPEAIAPIDLLPNARRQLIAACRYFALERLVLAANEEALLSICPLPSPQVVTCLQGAVEVRVGDATVLLVEGETVVIPIGSRAGEIRARSPTVLLRTWVPNLETEIVAPARAVGAGDRAIAGLAGALPDVRDALTAPRPARQ